MLQKRNKKKREKNEIILKIYTLFQHVAFHKAIIFKTHAYILRFIHITLILKLHHGNLHLEVFLTSITSVKCPPSM